MSAPADIAEFLATVRPFSGLADEAVERIADQLEMLYFRRGDTIGEFVHDDAISDLYIIRKGAVQIESDQAALLESRSEGDVFGHAIRFESGSQAYRAKAAEDSLIWRLPAAALEQAIARSPELQDRLTTDHGQRLRADSTLAMRVDTLADLALRSPCVASPDDTVADCAEKMSTHQVSSLPIVTNSETKTGLIGMLTDRDLRSRVVAKRIDPDTPVEKVMTPDPVSVALTARHESALVEMLRLGIHHLPVLNDDGELAGVVSAGDLLRLQSPHPLRLVRDLSRAEDRNSVALLAQQGPAMLADMAVAGADVTQVGRIAGLITDACTRRLLQLAEAELGAAPMPYAWLAFGSQARLEQGLISDQDNGLLLAEATDEEAEVYFKHLADFVCDGLNDCGYIYCPGGVMAKGEWRLSYDQWRKRFDRWMREPTPKSVMQSSIFFDLRPVYGDRELAATLQGEVLIQARDSEIFRRFLAAESITHRPPIGFFRQFVQERDGRHSRGLNLKKRGVIPIVDLARVHAIENALSVVHTEERLNLTAQHGQMSERDANDLIHALRFISGIRLTHQAEKLRAGGKPDHLVDPAELSGLHKGYLRSAFAVVQSAQQALSQRYLL